MPEPSILVDTDDIFASEDDTGMIITYTDDCPVSELSKMLLAAAAAGLDMKDQWWDVDDERHVLAFGDVEDDK